MRAYISGPMTGYVNHNQASFDQAAAVLRSMGILPVSPAEMDRDSGVNLDGTGWEASDEEYDALLDRDLEVLETVDAVVFIKGWEKSGGAGREGMKALELGKALYELQGNTLWPLTATMFIDSHTTNRLRPAGTTQEA